MDNIIIIIRGGHILWPLASKVFVEKNVLELTRPMATHTHIMYTYL